MTDDAAHPAELLGHPVAVVENGVQDARYLAHHAAPATVEPDAEIAIPQGLERVEYLLELIVARAHPVRSGGPAGRTGLLLLRTSGFAS